MFLVTTANQNLWKTDEKILFLGEWCKTYNQKHIWSNLDYEVLPSHWGKWEKLNDRYVYLDGIFESYLNSLTITLNNSHGEDHSSRYWRIILGPWLSIFIGVIYDRYLSIHSVINSKQATHTWIPPLSSERWVFGDSITFLSKAYKDINFNLYLYSQIITKLGKIPFEFKNDQAFSDLQGQAETKPLSVSANIEIKIKSLIGKISKRIPDRFNQIVFSSSGLSFGNQLKLQLSLGQIPYLVSPDLASSITPIEIDRRKNLKLPQGTNEFEFLLNDLMLEQFPTSFLEGYSEMRNKSLDAFPKNPKVIFTSYDFAYNDGFKFWTATQIERGVKLVLRQHGGGYGISGPYVTESHEVKICDKYFTWGWTSKEEPKIVPLTGGKLQGTQRNIKPDSKGAILWVVVLWPPFFIRIDHITGGLSDPKYLLRQARFLNAVCPEVAKILLMRFPNVNFGWSEVKRLADTYPAIKTYKGAESIYKQLRKSRLCIHDYHGTTWLETLSMNFPTIVFWESKSVNILKSAQPYLDDLHRVGILHYSPESAAKLANEIYEDPISWWSSPDIQEVREKFCHQFARASDEWLSQWKEELLKIAGGQKSRNQ
jgi:putative transferase (TIGR04331 family)